MQVSTPHPLRSSLRQPQAQSPSPLAPYTPVPDSSRTTPRNLSRTPRTPAAPLAHPPPRDPRDAASPKRRSWLSREPTTPRQRISNYHPIPSSPQAYPPFFPPQGYSPANSPWHTPGGRPIYVNPQYQSPSNHPSFPPPGRIAPVDSGLGVLSPPTAGPYSRPPRDSAISEEPSTQTPAPTYPQTPSRTPRPNPNFLVGSTHIPDNLQHASHGDDLNVDPGEGVLGPAGSAAGSSSPDVESPPPTSRSFVGGFVSGFKRAFGSRRREPEGYVEPFVEYPQQAYSNVRYRPPSQQQYATVPVNQIHHSAQSSTVNAEHFPENEPTVVGHQQHAMGANSRDPLSLPLETPFGSPSTIVTPFLLTRPVSAASGAGQGGDDADAQQDGSATTFYDNAPTSYANTSYAPDPSSYAGPDPSTYAPDPSSYAPPISLLTTTTPQVYTSPEGYRSPPQAPDYRKMQTDPTSIPLSGYLQRFKDFFQKLSNLPWVATDRVTVDYYPGMRKDGEWGRRERRWTVSWTRKGEGESSETERKSGKLAEIDLSSSSGSTPASPIQRGPNGIQYPPQQFQYPLPFWVTNAQQQQPQLYYSYGNPTLGNPIYPYAGGEGRAFAMVYPVQPVQLDQVLGQPVRVQMGPQQPIPPQAVQSQPVQQMQQQDQGLQPSQYPAGYAPDHRADRTVWGSPVHRVQVVSQGSAGVGMGMNGPLQPPPLS